MPGSGSRWSARSGFATVNATSVAVGDVTADGFADIVVGGTADTKIFAGTFTTTGTPVVTWTGFATSPVTLTDTGTTGIVLADLDNDTRLDLVVTSSAGDHYRLNTHPGTAWTLGAAVTLGGNSVARRRRRRQRRRPGRRGGRAHRRRAGGLLQPGPGAGALDRRLAGVRRPGRAGHRRCRLHRHRHRPR